MGARLAGTDIKIKPQLVEYCGVSRAVALPAPSQIFPQHRAESELANGNPQEAADAAEKFNAVSPWLPIRAMQAHALFGTRTEVNLDKGISILREITSQLPRSMRSINVSRNARRRSKRLFAMGSRSRCPGRARVGRVLCPCQVRRLNRFIGI